MAGFRWTGQKEEAALLVAQDELANVEIARRVGVSRQGLSKWKQSPEFMARVEGLVGAASDAMAERGIADRLNRVAALNERWEGLQAVMEVRARQMASVPGGDTGLLVPKVRTVKLYAVVDEGEGTPTTELLAGTGVAVPVAEYVVDVGLLRELREHEKQAAKELGQWGQGGRVNPAVVVREYVGVDVEKV